MVMRTFDFRRGKPGGESKKGRGKPFARPVAIERASPFEWQVTCLIYTRSSGG